MGVPTVKLVGAGKDTVIVWGMAGEPTRMPFTALTV